MSPHVHAPEGEEFIVVFSGGREEAWIVAGRLNSEDIETRMDPPDTTSVYPTAITALIDVLVPAVRADDAKRLIAEHQAG